MTVGGALFDTRVKARLNFKKLGTDKAIHRCGLALSDDFDPQFAMVTSRRPWLRRWR